MGRKLFNLKNTVIVAVLTLVAFIGFNSFKTKTEAPNKFITYYFQYIGTPGNEANKALWQHVTTLPSCTGVNDGCLIEVPSAFTTLSGSTRILTQNVPVVTVGTHKNPDTSKPMILNAANKNP